MAVFSALVHTLGQNFDGAHSPHGVCAGMLSLWPW